MPGTEFSDQYIMKKNVTKTSYTISCPYVILGPPIDGPGDNRGCARPVYRRSWGAKAKLINSNSRGTMSYQNSSWYGW